MSEQPNHTIRVVIQQLRLMRYRVPVFRELAGRPGIDLKIVCGQARGAWGGEGTSEGFEVEYIPVRPFPVGGRELRWHSAQWRYASRRRSDVLVLTWNLHFVTLVPALLKARLAGVPTVLWGHGYSKEETGWRRWLRERVTRLATAVLFYNHGMARQFLESGWDPKRVFVALNALDQKAIHEARQAWMNRPEDLQRFRRDHDLEAGPIMLFVSRLLKENRLHMLLEAAQRLRQEFPSLRVAIIGQGPDRERLEKVAEKLGVADLTRFTGAIYEETQLAPWFLSATAFVYPTNMGLSILHAFGYGLPAVTSDNPTAHGPEYEALETGMNGLLYRNGDVEDLAATLAGLFRNPGQRTALSAGALKTVEERFNVPSMVDGMEAAVRYAWSAGRSELSRQRRVKVSP